MEYAVWPWRHGVIKIPIRIPTLAQRGERTPALNQGLGSMLWRTRIEFLVPNLPTEKLTVHHLACRPGVLRAPVHDVIDRSRKLGAEMARH